MHAHTALLRGRVELTLTCQVAAGHTILMAASMAAAEPRVQRRQPRTQSPLRTGALGSGRFTSVRLAKRTDANPPAAERSRHTLALREAAQL